MPVRGFKRAAPLDRGVSELQRAPATVMFTDMVGYSELTQRDENVALQLLNEHRAIVRPLLRQYGGREVKTIGDAFMVEFTDPLPAVQCALAIQRKQAERNRDPSVPQVMIRIGLHHGEVIHQEGDLFGDTVNVASRIEPLAPPGGICLSAPVYQGAQEGLDVVAVPVGPATLKNIQLPVPILRIDLRPDRNVPVREGPWVDREEELRTLEVALESALAGKGRTVLIRGEVGVGKTRLAEQLIRAAGRQGARSVWGRASEEGAASPYSLWVQTLEEVVSSIPLDLAREAAGEYVSELARLCSAFAVPGSTPPKSSSEDTDADRDRLFTAVSHFLIHFARPEGLVILLDDLQWADAGSLRMLERFAGQLEGGRVLLLLLHRPDAAEPPLLREVLEGISRRGDSGRIELGNLPLAAVRQLVLAIVKTKAIPDELVRRIFDRTQGNPYFIEELLRSLKEGGLLTPEPGSNLPHLPEDLPLPDSVRRLVRQRIDRLDEPTLGFLRTVSVLGPEFELRPLEAITRLPSETVIERLGNAVSRGFLQERTDDSGRVLYAFPDRIVWETLYSDSPVARRVRDHLRAGEALESLARSGAPVPMAELAHHFQRAQATEKAIDYTLRAAEEAGRLYAREEAVRHYRTGLLLLESRPDDRVRARVLESLGDQLYRLGQLEAGQARRMEAAALDERLGDLQRAGQLHRKIAHAMREDPHAARHHWEEAIRLLESGPPSSELARLYTTIAGYRYEEGDAPGALDLYSRAIEVAKKVGDPLTQVSAQVVLAGLRATGEAEQLFRDLEEALTVARTESLIEALPNLYLVEAFALLHVRGDAPAAEGAMAEALEIARKSRDLYTERWIEGNVSSYLAWRRGEYERALRTVEAHLQYAAGDPRKLLATALLVDADIALTRGDPERSARSLEEAQALLEEGSDWSERVQLGNVRGRSELLRGRLPRARSTLAEAHALAERAGVPALMAVLHAETLHLELEVALQEGDAKRAGELEKALGELGERSAQPTIQAFAARARGLALRQRAELSAATASLEASVGLWERTGWAYELARTRLLLAEGLRLAGEAPRAQSIEDQARSYLGRIRAVGS